MELTGNNSILDITGKGGCEKWAFIGEISARRDLESRFLSYSLPYMNRGRGPSEAFTVRDGLSAVTPTALRGKENSVSVMFCLL